MFPLKGFFRRWVAVAPVAGLAIALGCQGPDEFFRYSDASPGTAGASSPGTAGTTGAGGTTGAAGTGGGPIGAGGAAGDATGVGGSIGGTAGSGTGTGGSSTGSGGTISPAGSGGMAGGSGGRGGSSAGRGGGAGTNTGTGGGSAGVTGTAGSSAGRGGSTGTAGTGGGTAGSSGGRGGGAGGSSAGSGGAVGTAGTTGTGGSGTGGSAAPGHVEVQAQCQGTGMQDIRVTFRILNPESTAKQLSDIKVRYYFTPTVQLAANVGFDYVMKYPQASLTTTVTSTYVEVGFMTGTGTLAAFDNVTGTDQIQLHIWNYGSPMWNASQDDDFSYKACAGGTSSTFTDRTTMPGYYQGQLAWGAEPSL